MSKINYRLKGLRVERNLTQDDISKLLKIHKGTYNRKEQGVTDFTLQEARRISKLFHKSIEYIFFDELEE